MCLARKCVPDFVGPQWKSNDGWMARTGCAFGNAICACGTVQIPRQFSQVLPAYGLQDLRNEKPNPPKSSNPNTMCLKDTLGEGPGSGPSYFAKNRTFLLCVDTKLPRVRAESRLRGRIQRPGAFEIRDCTKIVQSALFYRVPKEKLRGARDSFLDWNLHEAIGLPFDFEGHFRIVYAFEAHIFASAVVDFGKSVLIYIQCH